MSILNEIKELNDKITPLEEDLKPLELRMSAISKRKAEVRSILNGDSEYDIDALTKELDSFELEMRGKDNEKGLELRYNEINGQIKDLEEKRNKLQATLDKTNGQFRQIDPKKKEEERQMENITNTVEYRKGFMAYALTGEMPQEFRADATTFTADMGSVIPETIMNQIVEKLEATGMILPLVTRTSIKGGVSVPTSSLKPVATWVAEGATSDLQKKTTGSITFAYYKLRCAVAMSLEVDTVSLEVFERTLINNVVEAMVKALEQSIISGTGTGTPKGILTETPVAGQAIEASALSYQTIVDTEGALPMEYEANAVYVMTKKTFMSYQGVTDSAGQPIARTNFGIGSRPERTLLGRPVVLCNYLPSFTSATAGQVFAFIFNFQDYVLNTNYNMTIKRYEDNVTDDMVTKAIMLADGKVVDTNSLVTLAIPTI